MSKAKVFILALIILSFAILSFLLVKENNRNVQNLQDKGESPALNKTGAFTEGIWIKKYPNEYACFKFETPDGTRIVCDPYKMDEKVETDIVTESHPDADHTDISMLTGAFRLIQDPGEYSIKGIKITGIGGRHNKGDTEITNTIFVFDIEGIKIAHFASQGQVPSFEVWKKLEAFKGIDILLIQGMKSKEYSKIKMTVDECCNVIDRLNPRIVIPEHGTAKISEDFAKHYNSRVEYKDYNGFIITRELLNSIKGHRIIDMDNQGLTGMK